MDWLTDPNAWIGLLTLTLLEIVLGVDNIIFISILAGKLPAEQRARARRLGLLGAFFSRILLLLSIAWVVRLTAPLFSVLGVDISGAVSSSFSAACSSSRRRRTRSTTSSRARKNPTGRRKRLGHSSPWSLRSW